MVGQRHEGPFRLARGQLDDPLRLALHDAQPAVPGVVALDQPRRAADVVASPPGRRDQRQRPVRDARAQPVLARVASFSCDIVLTMVSALTLVIPADSAT